MTTTQRLMIQAADAWGFDAVLSGDGVTVCVPYTFRNEAGEVEVGEDWHAAATLSQLADVLEINH